MKFLFAIMISVARGGWFDFGAESEKKTPAHASQPTPADQPEAPAPEAPAPDATAPTHKEIWTTAKPMSNKSLSAEAVQIAGGDEEEEHSPLYKKLEKKAFYHIGGGSPLAIDLYMSSNCPYSQDFCERQLAQVMDDPELNTEVKLIPRFEDDDVDEDTGKVCTTGDTNQKQGCLGNLALAIVQNLQVPQDVKNAHLEATMKLFGEAPYTDDKNNVQLYKKALNEPKVKPHRRRVIETIENDDDQTKSIVKRHQRKFRSGKQKAREQAAELNSRDEDIAAMHDIFPLVFIDDQFVPVHNGVLYAEGFGMAKLDTLCCVANPTAERCQINAEIEKYSLHNFGIFKGPSWMNVLQTYMLVSSAACAAMLVVWWLRTVHPARLMAETETAFLDEEALDKQTEV
eukprot:GEMP01021693.1.p1 GENE.GEMP01021693.1~~GEMP01021693.1.p1  ORF type:complete len:400 (+),score=88.30 GEMP01021693.1:96-1295(+)